MKHSPWPSIAEREAALEAEVYRLREAMWEARKVIVDRVHDGSEYDAIQAIDAALVDNVS